MRKLFIFFHIVVLFSCSGGERIPSDIIPPSKMESVLWDFIKADVYSSELSASGSSINDTFFNQKMQEVIFKQHAVSKENFFKSYDFYLSHPKLMTVVLDSILSKNNKIKIDRIERGIPDFREK